MRFRLSEIAEATTGQLHGADVVVDGASIDSRTVNPGELFVAISAERDGHEFIPAAIAAGAAACLTQQPPMAEPAVVVEDTVEALQRIGATARTRVGGQVIGITGSVGKTTTKDLLHAALAQTIRTHSSYRSFNNELGVPLTLIQAPDEVDAVVVEMGARGSGHIRDLCRIARPDIGIVVAVGAAHTELFGTVEDVARAKGELVEALPASGTAVLNAADGRVMAMASRTSAQVLAFGEGGDVVAEHVLLDDALRPSFRLVSPWGSAECSLPAAGAHTVSNALAAAAAALSIGVEVEAVVAGLARAEISPWRMEVMRSSSGALIINDAYNANTLSMHAAIDALVGVPARRRLAVVGLMAELGERHASDHRAVGDRLAAEGVEVLSVGVPEYGGTAVDGVAGAAAALSEVGEGDVVLIKASRVAGLERLADLLR